LTTVEKINKLLKSYDNNNLPNIKYKPNPTSVTGTCVEDLSQADQKKFGTFGVIASTGTGDGGFECYVIDDDRSILLGGNTTMELLPN